ncbi:MAG: hypothetical protein ACYC0J_02515 [Gammaproteobacteria bacterium]
MPNTKYTAAELSRKLESQLNRYPNFDLQPPQLTAEGWAELGKGCIEYQTAHAQLVANYLKKHPEVDLQPCSTFFRKQFIKLISDTIASSKPAYENKDMGVSRQTHPESATTNLVDFLGPDGTELYRLALEEEMHSFAYRESVFKESTQLLPGKKWAHRPVIIVAGPSGCGKSAAAKQAIQNVNDFLPKIKKDKSGNAIIFIDGGKIRETSQIRKLAIQASNANGYSGITDLHDQSTCLDEVKKRIAETAFGSPTYGIVIPETYSKAGIVAGNTIISLLSDLPRIIKLKNSVPVFCHVKGKEPHNFQQVVKFMGSRRAWKTDFSIETDIDLNNKNICESKEYNAQYFANGLYGSEAAEGWYTQHSPNPLKLIITNDLILVKQDTETDEWEPAKQNDAGAILVSERTFIWWKKLKYRTEQDYEFGDDIPFQVIQDWKKLLGPFRTPPSLQAFSAVIPLPIKTSNEMKLAIVIERVDRHLSKLYAISKTKTDNSLTEAEEFEKADVIPIKTIFDLLKEIDTRKSEEIDAAIALIGKLKAEYFNDAPSALPRFLLKLFSSESYYLKQKAIIIIDTVVAMLKRIKVQNSNESVVNANNNPIASITSQVVIESTGLLAKGKREQIQTFIASKPEWEITNNEPKRIDIRKKDTPAATFKISEHDISTTYREKSLFKMMLETFLETNKEVKTLHIKAKDAGIKKMMEEVCTEAGLSKENVTIIIPSALKGSSLFNQKSQPVTPMPSTGPKNRPV